LDSGSERRICVVCQEKEEIFRRGAVISIKHGYIFEPVLSVIQKCEGECIYFRIPKEFLKNNVFKGDVVSCQVMQGEYEYIVSGIISVHAKLFHSFSNTINMNCSHDIPRPLVS